MDILFLLIGFFFLIKGADIFVGGASSIANKFKVPSMIIGLTIVAMGTSAPEAAVSITSSLAGQNDMAVANVVGSNFFNILVVLGVSSILAKLPVEEVTIKKELPFLIGISFMILIFSLDKNLLRFEGFLLLLVFILFVVDTIKNAMKNNNEEKNVDEDNEEGNISILPTIIMSFLGIVGIVMGGDAVVQSASNIATKLGMSANLVGLTIVAIGTSLPEFVTSIVAIKKGETDIAIGNVIGSNIFNILLVLGLSVSINPIVISVITVIDLVFMNIITLILLYFIKKDNSLVKKQGIILCSLYVTYMIYTIVR